MEFIDILTAVVAGIVLGVGLVCAYGWLVLRKLKSRVDNMIAEVIREAEADLIGIHLEIENGVYFCYNSTDRQFICQGDTVSDVKKSFQHRYPGKTAYLAGGDPKVVAEFKTELLKLATDDQ